MSLLESCGARILAVIDDNNRVNQTFFSKFTPFTNAMDCQGHYRSEEAGCKILSDWSEIATEMRPTSMEREKQLTVMTADAITWTCESLQSLAHFLLTTDEPCKHKSV
ncbi:hypothetical protein RRG08_019502 [Elysia crispata]|uniref:Uncharacterized protein n=1 Tax=Elysia crispata TaxID=231223 RepID=A0AAE0YIY1_9GAST|nr:hypothetical protein RRG08_019502 [Elysia crispata]